MAEEFPLIRPDCCLREERAVGIQREKKETTFAATKLRELEYEGKSEARSTD